MIELSVSIPGEPTGKGRGRVVRMGKGVRVVTPEKTRSYEAVICYCTRAAIAEAQVQTPISGPVVVEILCVHTRPGAGFKRVYPDARIPRPRKPDLDNVAKAVLDGMSMAGLWQDDGQVFDLRVVQVDGAVVDRKAKTSEAPHVLVTVRTVAGGAA